MAELALDHDQGHAFAGHLDGVGVAQLLRREAAPNPGRGGRAPQLRVPQRATSGAQPSCR